jgi:hypothetical protein
MEELITKIGKHPAYIAFVVVLTVMQVFDYFVTGEVRNLWFAGIGLLANLWMWIWMIRNGK